MAIHGYGGLIAETILSIECKSLPIKCEDFEKENSVTYRFFFHSLIFSGKPTFRFQTRNLLLLGFLYCTHRDHVRARDSLWGLINPQLKTKLHQSEAKEVMLTLVRIATEIPCSYYDDKYKNKKKTKKKEKAIGEWEFIKEVTQKGQGVVLNYIFQLPVEFNR